MFWNSLDRLRTKDSDNIVDKKIAELAKNLETLDRQYGIIDNSQELEKIKNLNLQAKAMQSLEKLLSTRMVRFVDRYTKILETIEDKKNKIVTNFHETDKKTKDEVFKMEKSKDKSSLSIVMKNYNSEKKIYESVVNNIHETEEKIKELKKIMNKTCKESAYNAKDISKHTWI